MEKASRGELLETINAQKEQLKQYKAKLRDVVAAYKSVIKEKEALEASLAALNSGSSHGNIDERETGNCEHSSVEGGSKVDEEDPLGINKQEGKDEVRALKEQVKTLSSSLTTLTQEKNKIEANFIAERKRLRHEHEELLAQVADEKNRALKRVEGFELQISDLKSRIRTLQLEREREQTDHALMLRELQMLLAKERSSREAVEAELEESQHALRESQQKSHDEPVVSEVYERQIQQLQKELVTVRDRLKAAENKANQPSPFVLELQKEMTNMKTDYQLQVEKEQRKAAEAESRLGVQAKQSEERVSSLEAKLSELSVVVGNYERLRFQDQQAINKLRERVTQLDMENTALSRAASLAPEKSQNEEDSLEVEQLLDKIMHFRSLLKAASEKSEKPVNLSSIFVEDMNKADEESPVCKQYKEELEQLKEEFERYKLRAQSVLKNKNKDGGTSRESEILKGQVADLRDKLRMANFHHQEEISEFQAKVDNLSKALLAQEEKFKQEIACVKSGHQKEINELEVEFKKQRDRTVAMLAEKDAEIQKLKTVADHNVEPDIFRHWGQESVDRFVEEGADRSCSQEELEAVNKLLELPKGVQNEAAFIHFAEERGRLKVDILTLRKQKRQLETALRDLQLSASQKEEKLRDEVNALTEQLADIERHSMREGANLEYLKNVLLKFLTSVDSLAKQKMLKALMTILQFSPQEKELVRQAQARGWWPT
ncbi:unnamed protein product [Candidula unifasciata]|uniref:GRIP domain-containing protein n=1 Tax=Candidula unifasciata TaxID=100452 RepID=A0A8S4A294_9EUPU|nr:unnamed protein product [Candidula unifasciata]